MTIVGIASGCADVAGPPLGSLEVRLTITGKRPDADGFVLTFDGGRTENVPRAGTTRIDGLSPGEHRIVVGGIAANCTVSDGALTVSVEGGQTAQVSLSASCPRVLGDEIVFTSEGAGTDIWTMLPDGSRRERLTTYGDADANASVSPDGRYIAYGSFRSGKWAAYLTHVDSLVPRELVPAGSRGVFDIAWAPVGNTIAYRALGDGQYGSYSRVWLIEADGTDPRPLFANGGDEFIIGEPRWSADGRRLRLYSATMAYYEVNRDGTGMRKILDCQPDGCSKAVWSPDESRIAFSRYNTATHDDIWVMNADGTSPRQLTSDTAQEDTPVWSPDGRQLVFNRYVGERARMIRINADGSGTEQVISNPAVSEDVSAWAGRR